MERFSRTELLIGKDKFERIKSSRVMVIGLGAVGSYAVEGLARAGVSNFSLVDFDKVEETNINRQLYALESTIGVSKVELAKARVLDICSAINVKTLDLFVNAGNLDEVLADKPDIVVDAIDALNPKVQLLARCYRKNIPVISSMGAALKTDPFMIRAGDLFDSRGCSLAKHVRKRLRRQGVEKGIFCVYSEEKSKKAWFRESFKYKSSETSDTGRARNVLGSLPTITGMFGLLIAHFGIKLLTRKSF